MRMSKSMRLRIASLIGLVTLVLASVATAQTLPPVSIAVSQSNVSGSVSYQYQVSNQSKFPITSVIIGLSYFDQKPELQTPPLGWSVTSGIPPSSVSSPSGWTAQITPTEDTDLLQLEWTTSGSGIAPGQALQGFSVLVPQADATYASSDWTVYVNGAGTNYYTGTLGAQSPQCDTPSISVSLSPNILWPPNHKLVTINAAISTQDPNYPNPTVRLLSITANESLSPGDVVANYGAAAQTFKVKSERKGTNKAGRVYTVTYSATNSCGNSATAAKTVVVPHDQSGS